MESANIHHQHQLQEHFVGASQPGYGVSTNHDCNPSIILNGSNYNAYVSEILPNSRELWPKDTLIVPQVKTSIIQDFRFCDARSFIHQSANNELHLAKVEEEMSDSFSQFSEVIHSPSSIEEFHLPSTRYIKNQQQNLLDLGENLWLSTFSPGGQISAPQLSARDLYTDAQNSASFGGIATSSRVNFRHDFPSTNISKLDFTSLDSGSLGLNLRALDLLASTNSGGSGSQSSHDSTLGHFKESMSLGHDHMQGSSGRPSSSSNRTSAFMNGVTRTKRPRNFSEPQASHAAVKKSRFLSRSSCPPLKVRKEKLGDRIAVLQRLVAPFGKTDTASVLTEAIGYIQFLQDQIQTLSVPYMKSPCSKPSRTIQASSSEEDGEEESKRDLGSRGLCLVPLSCTSYITSYHGGIWPLP